MLIAEIEEFAKDVDEGLSAEEKTLPSKYFYNKKGDELFVEIMNLPEYYLTRSEMEIFTTQTQALIDSFGLNVNSEFELIELGAGDGTKTRELLSALLKQQYQFDYIPIDISKNALDDLQSSLKSFLPDLSIKAKHGDYFTMLESLKADKKPKVVLFLGSNIGNMSDDVAADFLYQLGANLKENDKLLLGADLIKSADIVRPAYDDSQGVTKDFNINLLHRMNIELDANFSVDQFEHSPEYDEEEGIARSYLISKQDQKVAVHRAGKIYQFKCGEKIHTETSRKYNDGVLQGILKNTDFVITHKFTDKKNYFADYILCRH